ncbi:MAG TPA: hypothetical protein VIV40_43425 [Kofleriaceae bacterium]
MKHLVLALALLAACKKQEEPKPKAVPQMPAEEVKRSEDACKVYVDRVCACATTVPAATKQCELARALPEAVRIALEVATSPDSKPDIVQQSYASVRKTAKECIEQTAKLQTLGCP